MTYRIRLVCGALIVPFFVLSLPACEQEGPAERAGERVDRSVEEAGKAVEEAGED